MLPPQPLALIESAFAGAAIGNITPTMGGFTHHSAFLTIDGQPCAVKASSIAARRDDLRREARLLRLLQGNDLPVPVLLAQTEDAAWTVTVMRRLPGLNALTFYSDNPALLESVAASLGRLLAAVHRAPIVVADPDLQLAARFRRVYEGLPALGLDPDIHALLVASLEHRAWHSVTPGLVHGDAGVHNLLWHAGALALVDWEWAGWGCPLLDLAWIAWTLAWRRAPAALWQIVLAAYGDGPASSGDCSPGALRALALGQMAAILHRVQDVPEARAEWLRRVRWTQLESR